MSNIIRKPNRGTEIEVNHDAVKSLWIPPRRQREEVLEGRELISVEDAAFQAAQYLDDNIAPLSISGIQIHPETNITLEGQTRSGKTSVIKYLADQVLERISKGSNEKLIYFDAGRDIIPFVYERVGNRADVFILNPADKRSHAWFPGADVDGAASIFNLSQTFIPSKEHDTEFFNEAARGLASGAMDVFNLTGIKRGKRVKWTLRDMANAVRTPERMRDILKQHPEYLQPLISAFLDRRNQDVYATLQARMRALLIVAAQWDNCDLFSLRKFFASERGGVLILGFDRQNQATTLELNRMILERAAQILLDGEQTENSRCWLILDEFPMLKKVEWLHTLLKDGLKYGARTILGYQNFRDVVREYGADLASVFVSEATTHCLFRTGDADTAEHSARSIGQPKKRRWVRNSGFQISHSETFQSSGGGSHSVNHDKDFNLTGRSGGGSWGWAKSVTEGMSISQGAQEQILFEWCVSPAALQNLPKGVFYTFTHTVEGLWRYKYDWEFLGRIINRKSVMPEHRALDKREDPLSGYLRDWTKEDLQRLGLPEDLFLGDEKLDEAPAENKAAPAATQEQQIKSSVASPIFETKTEPKEKTHEQEIPPTVKEKQEPEQAPGKVANERRTNEKDHEQEDDVFAHIRQIIAERKTANDTENLRRDDIQSQQAQQREQTSSHQERR